MGEPPPARKFATEGHASSGVGAVSRESMRRSAGNPTAIFETTKGIIEAEIYLKEMPLTASNFIDLARPPHNFYNGLHFHRTIKNYVMMFGCPYSRYPTTASFSKAGTGTPEAGSVFRLHKGQGKHEEVKRNAQGCIEDEHVKNKECPQLKNLHYTLAMANASVLNTGGSQFLINLADNPGHDWWDSAREASGNRPLKEVHDLDPAPPLHPVFGKVVKGQEIINEIAREEGRRDVDFTTTYRDPLTHEKKQRRTQYLDPVPKNPVRVKSVSIDGFFDDV